MTPSKDVDRLRNAVALIRITLGVILLVTWWDNLQKGLYTAEGITGLFNWLFDAENGNASSLNAYKAILDATILQVPGLFAVFQLVAELLLGVALLAGVLTPLAGIGAAFFFANLFLAYFGGHEWIWTYVLLTVSALVVALTRAGRGTLGLDRWLLTKRGAPPYPLLW